MGWASVLDHYNGVATLGMHTDGQTEEGHSRKLPAEWVPRQVKGPVLMPQRSQASEWAFLTLWAWNIKVAVLVGIGGSFLAEAADVALKEVVVGSSL